MSEIQCDCCEKIDTDTLEIQEYLKYQDVAGYGASTYADGDRLELNLCQKCKHDLLGKYIRIIGRDF